MSAEQIEGGSKPSRFRRFLDRFGDKPSHEKVEEELATLEEQAQAPAPDYRAAALNRAGDLCSQIHDRDRALRYYGRAIDCYLEMGYYDVAASTCRKMIEQAPEVVRARCTLAFLSLGRGLPFLPSDGVLTDASREIADYVGAARNAGQHARAIKRLRLMSGVTDSAEIRGVIGKHLLDLGDASGADRVLQALSLEEAGLQSPAGDQRERWARVLRLSIADQRDPGAAPSPELEG
ncbi:hypothetical protein BH23GEM4_BH23GEM4_00730 [soil metagenome]